MKATRQHKRLTRNNAASSSDNSKSSNDEIQQVHILDNISFAETEDEIPGGGKATPLLHSMLSVLRQRAELLCLCILNCCGEVFKPQSFPYSGDSKSICSLCRKSYTCVDRKMKLTTSGLKNHLLRDHSSNAAVRAAYLLDETEKVADAALATP